MRTFQNGTFKTDHTGGFPPRNSERVPLVNSPPAHHLKMAAPERMFRKLHYFYMCSLLFEWFNFLFSLILALGDLILTSTSPPNYIYIVLGDPRTNQNPVILAFAILMFRWHNVLARRVQAEHPDWSDEDVFQRTRRLVIASLQVSTYIYIYSYVSFL